MNKETRKEIYHIDKDPKTPDPARLETNEQPQYPVCVYTLPQMQYQPKRLIIFNFSHVNLALNEPISPDDFFVALSPTRLQ